ncbi:hypothetical protein KKF34_11010 [Myxococcota bacterium]|nr:hypothetical protein [Myxococcota bacterium]MBU1379920.1 hypothetical protein [Myxococcota bacterium]MBU1497395.1 hypothetical protein [Myxococcota bacterium]
MRIFLMVLSFVFLASCDNDTVHNVNNTNNSNSDAGIDIADVSDATDGGDIIEPEFTASLTFWPLDIWGNSLHLDRTQVTLTGPDGFESLVPEVPMIISLSHEGNYTLCLESMQFHGICTDFSLDSYGNISQLGEDDYPNHGFLYTSDPDTTDEIKNYFLAIGLPHRWFASTGRPIRYNNSLDLLMDGEQAWIDVSEALMAATDSVLMATWWWESDFELIREGTSHMYLNETQRWENTALGILETIAAHKRILVGEFWGSHEILDWITSDSEIKAYAENPADDIEFMGQGNPMTDQFRFDMPVFDFRDRFNSTFPGNNATFSDSRVILSDIPGKDVDLADSPAHIAFQSSSWHQKFSVIDSDLTYVGGMNVKGADWDTSAHTVYEYRRIAFEATTDDRLAVYTKDAETDLPPRKDYLLKIKGPAAQDTANIFKERWDYLLGEGVLYSENSTSFSVSTQVAASGPSDVQITATMPPPFSENSILESWVNAFKNAQDYIFIEDQYFRMPHVINYIIDAMNANPALELIVVTLPINEWVEGGCYWTYETARQLKELFPYRFYTFQLRSFDTVETWGWDETESRFTDIYIHSKMLIVDDKFMSVGSCNKNNRGMIYEGELNAAVYDEKWVRAERARIVSNMLGYNISPDDDWINAMYVAAEINDDVYLNWENEGFDISLDGSPLPAEFTPSGFLYSLNFNDPSECLVENVSPDLF